jgi:dCMP deaminase
MNIEPIYKDIKMNWDQWYMSLATIVASKSKDPSTKVGCVIVRPDNTIASVGYNGFPRDIEDTPERLNERPTKYALTIHAEMNAIIAAREPLKNCKLYTTLLTCDRCFLHIIQAGIKHIVYPTTSAELEARWHESFKKVRQLADEADAFLQKLDPQ